MFHRKFFFILILFYLFVPALSAQINQEDSGAVINGKANYLARPSYPLAAKALRASGTVDVQVVIDETGTVISAKGLTGHPILRTAAEQAAMSSKFLPTTLEGKPVRVTGIIVYNFTSDITLIQIGYELALAGKSPNIPDNLPNANIAGNMPKDWEDERMTLAKIDLYVRYARRKELEAPNSTDIKKVSSDKGVPVPGETLTVQGEAQPILDKNLNLAKELNGLEEKIENRFNSDAKRLWYFKLGEILGRLTAEIDNSAKSQMNIDDLSKHIENPPADVAITAATQAREIVELYHQANKTADKKGKILILAGNLKNLQIGL